MPGTPDLTAVRDTPEWGTITPYAEPFPPGPITTPKVSFYIGLDCTVGGWVISVVFGGVGPDPATQYPVGTRITVEREDVDLDGLVGYVRGLTDISPEGTFSLVDYETPIHSRQRYRYVVRRPDGSVDPAEGGMTTIFGPLAELCGSEHYLRDLMVPETALAKDFCLGTIDEVNHAIHAGVFNVLGRPDPVAVVGTQEDMRGTLRFITHSRNELYKLRLLLVRSAEPMLLQVDWRYDLGRSAKGVLYFMPLNVRERWLLPDARIPQHALDVDFVEISPPPLASIFWRYGIPYDLAAGGTVPIQVPPSVLTGRTYPSGGLKQRWATYDDLTHSGKAYGQAYFDQA